ncbi:MAG: tetratricopeptide repeat protein [Acidobacteriota bacterium]
MNRLLITAVLSGLLGVLWPAQVHAQDLATVRAHIDAGQPTLALDLLRRAKMTPEARLLRGMARVMLGELKAGGADLEKAVAEDPSLREGWMNLAGLEIAEGNFQEALGLLEKAQALEPQAPDIQLNMGAVMLMLGRTEDADARIARYVELDRSAEARYLAASNYALAQQPAKVVEYLRQAITLDERMRMRARLDGRFSGIDEMDYRVLLHSDLYSPPAGHRTAAAAFKTPYDQKEPALLYAVLEALQEVSFAYDPEVESTARWALIWGDKARIKVHTQDNGTGVVSMSGPPDATTASEWQRTSQELFRAVHRRLDRRPLKLPKTGGP